MWMVSRHRVRASRRSPSGGGFLVRFKGFAKREQSANANASTLALCSQLCARHGSKRTLVKMSTQWSNDRELVFLELYQAEPVLWQAQHEGHKNKNKLHDAWTRISAIMEIPVPDLKKKRDSLMSSYRTYRKKVKDSIHSGASTDEVYKPIWFAYETMDSFLGEGVACNKTINSVSMFYLILKKKILYLIIIYTYLSRYLFTKYFVNSSLISWAFRADRRAVIGISRTAQVVSISFLHEPGAISTLFSS